MEPFGHDQADLGSRMVASTIANVNRDAKRRPDPFTPKDFDPAVRESEPEAMTHDQIKTGFRALMERQKAGRAGGSA